MGSNGVRATSTDTIYDLTHWKTSPKYMYFRAGIFGKWVLYRVAQKTQNSILPTVYGCYNWY